MNINGLSVYPQEMKDRHCPNIIIEQNGRAWAWVVKLGNRVLAGGYCRTKRDAMNDATIAMNGGDK